MFSPQQAAPIVWLTVPAAGLGAAIPTAWFGALASRLLPAAIYQHLHQDGVLAGGFGLAAVGG